MFFPGERNVAGPRGWRHLTTVIGLGLASNGLLGSFAWSAEDQQKVDKSSAQTAPAESANEKLDAVVRERDELKRRNAHLELRLKQLQTAVDGLVHQALSEQPPVSPSPLPPSAGVLPRPYSGPIITRFRPIYPLFPGTMDPVELATAFGDALGEREAAKHVIDAAKQKGPAAKGHVVFDADAAAGQLLKAKRKVQLLRTIIMTARKVAAEEADRMRKLGAVHAVSVAEVRNAEARLTILDQILAADPEPPTPPAGPPASRETIPTKPLFPN
jgi:hypothetical protein